MGEVPHDVHEQVIVGKEGLGAKDVGVTMLFIVEAMKFETLVVRMFQGMLSVDGTIVMGTVGA